MVVISLDGGGGSAEQQSSGGGSDRRRSVHLRGAGIGSDGRGTGADGLEPAMEVGKILEILALPGKRHDPGVAGHVGDGMVLPRHIGAVGQPLVEYAVRPAGLPHVAVDGTGDLLRRVLAEVAVLPGHRAQPAQLPEQPLQDLGACCTWAGGGMKRPVLSAR
jgi:hypothetical protein